MLQYSQFKLQFVWNITVFNEEWILKEMSICSMARKIIDSRVKILGKEIDNFWSRDTWKVKSTNPTIWSKAPKKGRRWWWWWLTFCSCLWNSFSFILAAVTGKTLAVKLSWSWSLVVKMEGGWNTFQVQFSSRLWFWCLTFMFCYEGARLRVVFSMLKMHSCMCNVFYSGPGSCCHRWSRVVAPSSWEKGLPKIFKQSWWYSRTATET